MIKWNIGCGSDLRKDYMNIDTYDAENVDPRIAYCRHNLNDYPWPTWDNSVDEIFASHVLEHLDNQFKALQECERILKPKGKLIVLWPIGMNEYADYTHNLKYSDRWTFDTPNLLCGKESWQNNLNLQVIDKDISIHNHLNGKINIMYKFIINKYRKRYGIGRWMFDLPFTSGEFKVVFKKQ